jgi:hypothetical protein
MELSAELETSLALYRIATGHGRDTAIARLIEIGYQTWQTDDYYKPERVCGRVRPVRVSP